MIHPPKNLLLNLALAALVALAAIAAASPSTAQHNHQHHGGDNAASQAVHTTTGLVREVDAASGRVVLDHDAVPSIPWPPMIMGFTVDEAGLLDGLKPGDRVRFDFRIQDQHNCVIVDMERL